VEIDTHDLRLDFGKHRGERVTRLPVSYLRWMVNEGVRTDIARAELVRRGTTIPAIEISGHAVDTASLRIRRTWHEDRRKSEGLYSWLHRRAVDARDHGERDSEGRYVFLGIRWVFAEGEVYPTLKTVTPVRSRES